MKKGVKILLRIIGIIVLFVLVCIVVLVVQFRKDSKIQAEDQALMIKSDVELLGKHLYIERDGEKSLDVNWYAANLDNTAPLVINLHGGAFIAGDADTLDTQSQRISETWHVNVATINYSLLKGDITHDYVIQEIEDTVKYFMDNADEYQVDKNEIYIMGYSAGGYYAMASTLSLHEEGIAIKGQILCYAFIGDIMDRFDSLTDEQKKSMPKALFLLADNDPLSEASLKYQEQLASYGVDTEWKKYEGTTHGFIEENNPEYEKLHKKNRTSKSPDQENLAREAETDIGNWISKVGE